MPKAHMDFDFVHNRGDSDFLRIQLVPEPNTHNGADDPAKSEDRANRRSKHGTPEGVIPTSPLFMRF